MIRVLKRILLRIAPPSMKETLRICLGGYRLAAYAQEGEDMILRRLFEGKPCGFFVDIGAHHPQRFSNTYFFYEKGWRGINIDAMPGSMELFNKHRPGDINIEAAVSSVEETLTYYVFNEPALNGFSANLSVSRSELAPYHILYKTPIRTVRLESLLDKHLPSGTMIDFMSIDVEGLDLQVLKSNDWQRFRPTYVLVEALNGGNMQSVLDSETSRLMVKNGYELFARSMNTCFYRCCDSVATK